MCVCAHWVVCVHQAVCVPVCFPKGECWEKDQGPVLGFSGGQAPAVLSHRIPTAGMQRVIHCKPGLCMAKGRPCTNALHVHMGFPGGSDSKESACNAETWVQSLGQEDPLEKEMATHSSILAWKIP